MNLSENCAAGFLKHDLYIINALFFADDNNPKRGCNTKPKMMISLQNQPCNLIGFYKKLFC